jgi:multimeric flavodoxin WrbA
VKSLLVVYHSQSGASAALARATCRGISSEDQIQLCLRRAWDADTDDLESCAGVVLVAAENSGSLAGGMKDFLDRSFYPAIARGLVRPVALIISAGNDGRGAQRQFERILRGYPFPLAMEPLLLRGEVTPAMCESCEQLGAAMAAGVGMGIF